MDQLNQIITLLTEIRDQQRMALTVPPPQPIVCTAGPAQTAPAAVTAVTAVPEAPKPISREELGKALTGLAKTDLEKAKAVLAKFELPTLAQAAEKDYPAILAEINHAISLLVVAVA